jgi:hypothetical protein
MLDQMRGNGVGVGNVPIHPHVQRFQPLNVQERVKRRSRKMVSRALRIYASAPNCEYTSP